MSVRGKQLGRATSRQTSKEVDRGATERLKGGWVVVVPNLGDERAQLPAEYLSGAMVVVSYLHMDVRTRACSTCPLHVPP